MSGTDGLVDGYEKAREDELRVRQGIMVSLAKDEKTLDMESP